MAKKKTQTARAIDPAHFFQVIGPVLKYVNGEISADTPEAKEAYGRVKRVAVALDAVLLSGGLCHEECIDALGSVLFRVVESAVRNGHIKLAVAGVDIQGPQTNKIQ